MSNEEMSTGQKLKYGFYALIAFYFIYSFFIASPTTEEVQYEEVEIPSQGIATILQEVQPETFKIEDEITLASTEDSYIVAKYMDSTIDTFTLAEVQLMAANEGTSPRNRSLMRAASYGFFGYMMGRSMSSPVRSSAYMDQKTYNKVNNNAGKKMRSTATRTRRAKPAGKSGYGSGKSTRSYGG
ncbi:MAG: hypothetical protein AB8F74_14965 [Saprospiraceae bacterium]